MSTLLDKYLELRAELMAIKSPVLSGAERDSKMSDVKAFFSGMNDSQGAVTAANLYTKEYLLSLADLSYRNELLDFLLDSFLKASILIEDTYNMWKTIRGFN